MYPLTFMLIFSLHMNHTHTQKKKRKKQSTALTSTAFGGQLSTTIYSFQMSYEHNLNAATWQHSLKGEAYRSQKVGN